MLQRKNLKIPEEYEMKFPKIADHEKGPQCGVAADVSHANLSRHAAYLRQVHASLEQANHRNFVPEQDMETLFSKLTNNR